MRVVDENPTNGSDALQVTLRYGENPIDTRAWTGEGELLPEADVPVRATRRGSRWVVEGPEGRVEVAPGAPVSVRSGPIEIELQPVARRRFSRFSFVQGDIVLPVLVTIVGVAFYQLVLLASLLFPPDDGGGNSGFEPTPELIARLLDGDLDGAERGFPRSRLPGRAPGTRSRATTCNPVTTARATTSAADATSATGSRTGRLTTSSGGGWRPPRPRRGRRITPRRRSRRRTPTSWLPPKVEIGRAHV